MFLILFWSTRNDKKSQNCLHYVRIEPRRDEKKEVKKTNYIIIESERIYQHTMTIQDTL